MDRRSKFALAFSVIALLSVSLGTWAASAHTQTYQSNLTIHFDKKTNSFDGHVGTSSFCQEGRLIDVFQQTSGAPVLVGSTTSGHAGQWSGVSSPGAGTYFATVDARHDVGYGHDHLCLADTSGSVTVR
jgi:hypothetical protein